MTSKKSDKTDDTTDALDFWMDDSNSNIEVSSDDDIPITPIQTSKKSSASSSAKSTPKSRTKKKTPRYYEEEDDIDILPGPPQQMFQQPQQPQTFMPNTQLNNSPLSSRSNLRGSIDMDLDPEFIPYEYNYAPLKSKESQSLENAVNALKRELNALKKDDDSDDDVSVYEAPNHPIKNDGDITLIFKYEPDNFETEINLPKGTPFLDIIPNLPEKYQSFNVQIDGLTYHPKEVYNEYLNDYCIINLLPREDSESEANLKKLAFLLPNGEKRKIAIDKNKTFADVLNILEMPKGKLMFDGEPLLLTQRICDNDDLEDGDQIDVSM